MKQVPASRRFAVIMAGGIGSRFWPWSRRALPKQLLALAGDTTMLEDTALRLRGIVPPENLLIVTSESIRKPVAKAVPWLPASSILCEPVGRNTAPCVGWAAIEVRARQSDGVMAVLPADHLVSPLAAFKKDLRAAYALADAERCLVTFGVRPTEPATGYGYIRAGEPDPRRNRAAAVIGFEEKPTPERAKRFLRAGGYYWNSGMFVWRADTVLDAFAEYLPGMARLLERMDGQRKHGKIPEKTLARTYPRLGKISIDYGIMEKAANRAMIPASFEWNDIGSWDAAGALWPSDNLGNSSRGDVIAINARNNVVAAPGKTVALVGVEGLAIVDTGDAMLVCRREDSQNVRAVLEELERRKRKDLL